MKKERKIKKITIYRTFSVLNGQFEFRKVYKVLNFDDLVKTNNVNVEKNKCEKCNQPNIIIPTNTIENAKPIVEDSLFSQPTIQHPINEEPILVTCPEKQEDVSEKLEEETSIPPVAEESQQQKVESTPIVTLPIDVNSNDDELYQLLFKESQNSDLLSDLNNVIYDFFKLNESLIDTTWRKNESMNWNVEISFNEKIDFSKLLENPNISKLDNQTLMLKDVKLVCSSLELDTNIPNNFDSILSIVEKTKILESLQKRLSKANAVVLKQFAMDNKFDSKYIATTSLDLISNENNLAKFELEVSLYNGFKFKSTNENSFKYSFAYEYEVLSKDNLETNLDNLSTQLANLYISNFDTEIKIDQLGDEFNNSQFEFELKVLNKKQNAIHKELNMTSDGETSLSPNVYYYEFDLNPRTNFSISKDNLEEIEKALVNEIIEKIETSGKIKQIPYIVEYVEQNTNFLSLIQDDLEAKLVLVMQSRILAVESSDVKNFKDLIKQFNKTAIIKNVSVGFQNLGIFDLLNSANWLSLIQNPFIGKYSQTFGFDQSANIVIDYRNGNNPVEILVQHGIFNFSEQLWNCFENDEDVKLSINANNLDTKTISFVNHKFGKHVLLENEIKFNNPLDIKTVISNDQTNELISLLNQKIRNNEINENSFTMEWANEEKVVHILSDANLRQELLNVYKLNDTSALNIYVVFNNKTFADSNTFKLFIVNKIGYGLLEQEGNGLVHELKDFGEFIENQTQNNAIQFGYAANKQYLNPKFINQDSDIPTNLKNNKNILNVSQLLLIKSEFKLF